jgi:hypothetical protein
VELLERVVREDRGVHLVGHLEDERVAASDRPGRRSDEFAVDDARLELLALALVDPVAERRVDDDGELHVTELVEERAYGFVQLSEARRGAPFGGDVRSVDDDVRDGHVTAKSSSLRAHDVGPCHSRVALRSPACRLPLSCSTSAG